MVRHTDTADNTRFAVQAMSVWSRTGMVDQWVHDDTGDLVEVPDDASSAELLALAERARAHVELFETLALQARRDEQRREREVKASIAALAGTRECPNRDHPTRSPHTVTSTTSAAGLGFHRCNGCGYNWTTTDEYR